MSEEKKTILVVDDEPRIVQFVTMNLELEGFRVMGLDLGADDYLTKPFSPRELVSRIRAVFRRMETSAPPRKREVMVDEDLYINFDQHKVIVRGQEMHLRPTEYRLLQQFVTN